jgi:hypothetical protein
MTMSDAAIDQVVAAYRALSPEERYVLDLHFGDLDNALWRLFAVRNLDVAFVGPEGKVPYA